MTEGRSDERKSKEVIPGREGRCVIRTLMATKAIIALLVDKVVGGFLIQGLNDGARQYKVSRLAFASISCRDKECVQLAGEIGVNKQAVGC